MQGTRPGGREPLVWVSRPDGLRGQRKHYLLHSVGRRQRQVCGGGMVGVQADLRAAGVWLLPASGYPSPKGQGGSVGFAQPAPQPARGGWGILYKL